MGFDGMSGLGYKGIGEECNGNINSDDRIAVREGMNKMGNEQVGHHNHF